MKILLKEKKKIWFVNISKLHQRVMRLQSKKIEKYTCKAVIDGIFVDRPGFILGGNDSW